MEIWKNIPLILSYEVSNFGRVRRIKNQRILTPNMDRYGYYYVTLTSSFIAKKSFKIHRLVAYAFIGVSDMQIDHINNIKTDNRPVNLQYCDSKFNNQKRSKVKFGSETNVNWHKGKRKYQVRITKDGKRIHIGTFKTKEEAIKSYQNAV